MVLQHQLVRCYTYMEGIGLGPALQYQDKIADSKVKRKDDSSLVVERVKDQVLSLHWPGWLLWHEFDPWPGTSTCHRPGQKKRKKKKKDILRSSRDRNQVRRKEKSPRSRMLATKKGRKGTHLRKGPKSIGGTNEGGE